MSLITLTMLLAHIIFGLIGIIASVWLLLLLFKSDSKTDKLILAAKVAFLGQILAWVSGGFYYTTFYGKAVKPIVKASAQPWAHSLMMETKEHIFLFLPVLALATLLVLSVRRDAPLIPKTLLGSLRAIVLIQIFIGVAIVFMGILVSGAAT